MLLRFVACMPLLVAFSFSAVSDDTPTQRPARPTNAGFEKLKQLVGTWVEADKDGKATDKVVSIIKLTAGGSAVHETHFPGQPLEMISVYTAEGPDVVLTHYCVIGNQPRLKAEGTSASNQLNFQFAGGANLDPKKDKHMHSVNLTIVNPDQIELDGTGWDNGAPTQEMCHGMTLVRKK